MNRKIITQVFLFAVIGFVLLSCPSVNTLPGSDPGISGTKYSVSVEYKWTAANNPSALGTYPGKAHFSPLVISSHKSGEGFFAVGQKASAGVKIMAETGKAGPLLEEIKAQAVAGKAHAYFSNGKASARGSETVTTRDVTITKDFAYVSISTMIAPSPDWFLAPLTPIKLTDDNGNFKTSAAVTLYGFDAGTDSGALFNSDNSATNPAVNIHRLGTTDAVKNFVWATVTLTKK